MSDVNQHVCYWKRIPSLLSRFKDLLEAGCVLHDHQNAVFGAAKLAA